MRRPAILFLLIATLLTPSAHAKPAAGVSGVLSIVPGLGQVANGDTLEGVAWFSSVVGLWLVARGAVVNQVGYDLWLYNMYDAYRDAGPSDKRWSDNNVAVNYIATFNPLNLIDPIGAPIVGVGALASGASNHYAFVHNPSYIPYYGVVALGEEGLFRGFLFPGFSNVFGSKVVGATLSSALFALFHITNGKAALGAFPLAERFVLGMLFCWQTDRQRYDLRHSIFAHAWFDTFVAPGAPPGKISGGQIKYDFPL